MQTPRAQWVHTLQTQGLSVTSARSFAAMTDSVLKTPMPEHVTRMDTTLQRYVDDLVAR